MPALNTESITITSTIEPNSHTPALIHASSLMLVGFTLTSCLCQNDFVAQQTNGPGSGVGSQGQSKW